MSEQRELGLVAFGATGFVGRLVAAYLACAAQAGMRIGLAGRSPERLAAIRDGLSAAAATWPLLLADLTDVTSLAALAGKTRVLVTTTGPYPGEVCRWSRRASVPAPHYADAAANSTRIVHACVVDSIPSDLGVLLLAEQARADGAGDLKDTISLVTAFRGGFSGGTLATMRRQLEEEGSDAERRRIVADPYPLSPDRSAEPELGAQRDLR